MSFEAAFNNVLQQVHLRGIRIREFFRDFDPLRSYKCSPSQFSRVLATSHVTLSDDEVNALIQHYLTDDGKLVHYKQFVDEVEDAFVKKDLQKSPTLRTTSRDFSLTQSVTLSPEEQQIYVDTLSMLQQEVSTRHMSIMDFFQDHDRLQNHHITVPQFIRCLPFSLTDEQIAVIVKKYVDGKAQDGINYYQFVFDVSNPPESTTRDKFNSTDPLVPLPQPVKPPPEAVAVLTKVQAIVLKGRIRLMEFFSDFDKLRSYVCLPEHFRTALSAAKVELTEPELKALEQQYRVSPTDRRVRYQKFVKEVDEVFGQVDDLEKNPLQNTAAMSLRTLLPSRLPDLAPETVALAQRTMDQICRYARDRRPMTKSFFQTFDIMKSGQMPPAHFRSTVSSHYGGSALTDEMLQCLSQYYTDPSTSDVRYLDFLNDIDEYIARADEQSMLSRTATSTRSVPTDMTSLSETHFVRTADQPPMPEFRPQTKAPDANVLIERLKLQSLRERARLTEFMKDYDPLRTGLINEQQFRAALSLARIDLSDREFALLIERYTDQDALARYEASHQKSSLDTRNATPLIRWSQFCDDVESIFTVKDLQRSPQRKVEPATIATLRNLSIIDPVYSQKSQSLEDILEEYHSLVLQRRIFLKPTFHDFDHHNNGKITLSHFTQALDIVGLPTDAERIKILFEHYRDMIVPTDVNYLAFLHDVEAETAAERQLNSSGNEDRTAIQYELDKQRRKKVAQERAMASIPSSGILRDLQARSKQLSIRWPEFFTDYDKQRTGYVSRDRFRSCCSVAGVPLSDREYQVCCDEFSDSPENHPGQIHYTRFSDVMDIPFTTKGLETDPTAQPTPWVSPERKGVLVAMSPEELEMARTAIERFHKVVVSRRLFMMPHLQDFDRLHNGHITNAQFRGSCGTLGLTFASQEEQEAVIERFNDSLGFMYRDFVNACETGKC